jgi:hypothetical protein
MTISAERRSFIQGAGLVATAASTAALAASPAFAQSNQPSGVKTMPYQAKPMSLDPKSIKGISEKVLVSHYENNYVGAVKRLNAIGAQLAELDFAKAPNFMVNGLKREELIAANSMILHEIYFDGLGGGAGASGPLAEAIARDFGSLDRWRTESPRWARQKAAVPAGSSCPTRRATSASSINGRRTTPQHWRAAGRCWCSTCMSTPITWTMAQRLRAMSTSIWRQFGGTTPRSCTMTIAAKLASAARDRSRRDLAIGGHKAGDRSS